MLRAGVALVFHSVNLYVLHLILSKFPDKHGTGCAGAISDTRETVFPALAHMTPPQQEEEVSTICVCLQGCGGHPICSGEPSPPQRLPSQPCSPRFLSQAQRGA